MKKVSAKYRTRISSGSSRLGLHQVRENRIGFHTDTNTNTVVTDSGMTGARSFYRPDSLIEFYGRFAEFFGPVSVPLHDIQYGYSVDSHSFPIGCLTCRRRCAPCPYREGLVISTLLFIPIFQSSFKPAWPRRPGRRNFKT